MDGTGEIDTIKDRIKTLLSYDEKFRRYQAIPEFLLQELNLDLETYSSTQLAWDQPRYDWIVENLPERVGRVTELGSSLGYFCLRLAHDHGLSAVGFEPVSAYTEVCNLFAKVSGLETQLKFRDEPAVLGFLTSLPPADLLVSLNVMHHAGNIFDTEMVEHLGGWRNYALEYLSRLTEVAPHLVLQTGNSAHGIAHFPSEEAVSFTTSLLEDAGWRVDAIGVVENFEHPAYATYTTASMDDIPRFRCRRNPDTGLVEYRVGETLVAELSYGTLQRPMFKCTRAS